MAITLGICYRGSRQGPKRHGRAVGGAWGEERGGGRAVAGRGPARALANEVTAFPPSLSDDELPLPGMAGRLGSPLDRRKDGWLGPTVPLRLILDGKLGAPCYIACL